MMVRRTLTSFVSPIANILIPEALAPLRGAQPPPELGPTAWVDGLRGISALCICFFHLVAYTHRGLQLCHGHEISRNSHNISPAAFPLIRIVFTGGKFFVPLLFTISGYVLPRKLLDHLRKGRRGEDFTEALHSAIFRRPIRLLAPVLASTLSFALVIPHGLRIATPFPLYQRSIGLELVAWCKDAIRFAYWWQPAELVFMSYNGHSWTTAVELKGSILIYVWVFATHRMLPRVRLGLTAALVMCLIFGTSGSFDASFLAGMFVADSEILAKGRRGRVSPSRFVRRQKNRQAAIISHATLLAGLYLASQPWSDTQGPEVVLSSCPGWRTLHRLIPPSFITKPPPVCYQFWFFWAALAVFVSVKELGWPRRALESRLAQYLGRHSFALYLIHGPMIGILSHRLFYLTGVIKPYGPVTVDPFGVLYKKWSSLSLWPLPAGGHEGLAPNFLACSAVSLLVMLYVAEIGTKLFVVPGSKLANGLYAMVHRGQV